MQNAATQITVANTAAELNNKPGMLSTTLPDGRKLTINSGSDELNALGEALANTPKEDQAKYPSGKVILSPSGIPRMLVSA